MARLITVSIFSGCGGADLGATRAGVEIVFATDISPNAMQTYRKYQTLLAAHSVELRVGDISLVRAVPPGDLLIGCYPCQSYSMGGPRQPERHVKAGLFREYLRCLNQMAPKFFVVENVPGMAWLKGGQYLREQVQAFAEAGLGYFVSSQMLDAKDYGVPQSRKRVLIVGVRKDLGLKYHFPKPTHGPGADSGLPYVSHGDTLASIPVDRGDPYYEAGSKPFSWWYMSRNRKRKWEDPSFTISGNWRHVPLHPSSPTMTLVESNLSNGSKQRWEFTTNYDHLDGHTDRPTLPLPRRLTWRECAAIQGFPRDFEPEGSPTSKHLQIGNAVPPLLMQAVVEGITTGNALSIVSE